MVGRNNVTEPSPEVMYSKSGDFGRWTNFVQYVQEVWAIFISCAGVTVLNITGPVQFKERTLLWVICCMARRREKIT